ncbi:MAG TPA: hypothetical protein VIU37_08695, partial [Candidatus Limnocylindrales bacterium]
GRLMPTWAPRPADGAPVRVEGVPPWLQATSPRLSDGVIVVAASDADQSLGSEVADFYCDGVSDEAEINAAIAALPSRGGTIRLSDGRFNLAAPVIFGPATAAKKIVVDGGGALLSVADGITGLKINQGSLTTVRGVHVYNLRIDGGSFANNIGVTFEDTNWSGLHDVLIDNIGRGILMHANATNNFVEGISLDDVVIRTPGTYGLEYRRTNGTNSFGQHRYSGLYINAGAATGVLLPSGCSIYRCRLNMQVWIATGGIAYSFDGDADGATLRLAVEGATGSTGNTALVLGANATNWDRADIDWYVTGTINTEFSISAGRDWAYRQGRHFKGHTQNTTSPLRVMNQTDSAARITFGNNGASGGRITFGNGSGTNDGFIERAGANVLAVGAAKLRVASFKSQTKAGAPVDGDITGGAEDGDMVLDTTNSKIWFRVGGVWKGVVIA